MEEILKRLPERLLPWYEENRRELPWRRDREPYHVWVSEIMLQQTRVEAVRGYYTRFLEALPTVFDLARAEDDRLRKLWEGLGYYTRVRNLKKAAQVIVSQYGGVFPRTYEEVLGLPGVGEYTAGAVCSIAFDLPTPAVDGNVLRVLARLLEDSAPVDLPETKKQARLRLEKVYPQGACGAFTQALMELGATVCLPGGEPRCGSCPVGELCRARASGRWRELPCRTPKRPRRQEDRTVFLLSCEGRFALERRQEQGLLAGLWQFSNVPGALEEGAALEQAARWGLAPRELLCRWDRSHIFTHIRWDMRCYRVDCGSAAPSFTWLTPEEIRREAALPTAFRQFWDLAELVAPEKL